LPDLAVGAKALNLRTSPPIPAGARLDLALAEAANLAFAPA
jgi:hypothetical protein